MHSESIFTHVIACTPLNVQVRSSPLKHTSFTPQPPHTHNLDDQGQCSYKSKGAETCSFGCWPMAKKKEEKPPCRFPFTYKGQTYTECTTDSRTESAVLNIDKYRCYSEKARYEEHKFRATYNTFHPFILFGIGPFTVPDKLPSLFCLCFQSRHLVHFFCPSPFSHFGVVVCLTASRAKILSACFLSCIRAIHTTTVSWTTTSMSMKES